MLGNEAVALDVTSGIGTQRPDSMTNASLDRSMHLTSGRTPRSLLTANSNPEIGWRGADAFIYCILQTTIAAYLVRSLVLTATSLFLTILEGSEVSHAGLFCLAIAASAVLSMLTGSLGNPSLVYVKKRTCHVQDVSIGISIKGYSPVLQSADAILPTMSRTIHDVQAKRIIFSTSLSFDEVTTRLDQELSRDKAGPKVFELLRTATSREELERGLQEMSGGKDFV